MKEKYRSFIRFWLFMQLPIYGAILYVLLFYFSYFYAWVMTNTLFAILMFPFHRKYIFKTLKKR